MLEHILIAAVSDFGNLSQADKLFKSLRTVEIIQTGKVLHVTSFRNCLCERAIE